MKENCLLPLKCSNTNVLKKCFQEELFLYVDVVIK